MKKQTDVLVIGGGFGGICAAQKLAKNGVDVTLVDRKDYAEITIATLRNLVDPKTLGNTLRKHYSDFISSTFIQAGVESMNDKEAKLTNGETISFKRAVISSGSRYPTLPLAKSESALGYAERNQEMLNEHKTLAAAQSVLIIGGGIVGVELAGEITSAFPTKEVTLAHSGDTLLNGMKPKAQRRALEQLTAKGVKIKFNRRFVKDGDVYRCSKSDETLEADLAYVCVGLIPNTEFLQAELPHILNEKKLVKVDSSMKVEGYENLYSIGDCSTLDENRHGYIATQQGGALAENLLKLAEGKEVKPYKNPPPMVIVGTGIDSGVAQMPFGVITMKFFVNLKQKNLGINNMYKTFGTKPDKLS